MSIQKNQLIEQIKWLKKHFYVLPLPEAISLIEQNKLPPRAVCITVDDGYRDSYDIIYKILKQLELSATFFISTEGISNGCLWDEMIFNAIFDAPQEILSIKINGKKYELDGESKRATCRYQLTEKAKYLALLERNKFINEIKKQCRFLENKNNFLTEKQIRIMHSSGMTIGAHTHSHPILVKENEANVLHEINLSKVILETIIGEPVEYFAYPNGRFNIDFDKSHMNIVESLGFKAALSTDWGTLSDLSKDRFQIKRFTPWDETELKFCLRLALNYRN